MRKSIAMACIVAFAFTAGSLSVSGQPSGSEDKGKVPSGFSQGEKAGWQNEYPPGWENKSEKEKKNWNDDVQKRKKNVLKAAKKKGISESEAGSVADDFEKATRKGLEAKKAEAIVKGKIKKGEKGQELSESVAEESEKIIEKKNRKDKLLKEKGKNSGKAKKK